MCKINKKCRLYKKISILCLGYIIKRVIVSYYKVQMAQLLAMIITLISYITIVIELFIIPYCYAYYLLDSFHSLINLSMPISYSPCCSFAIVVGRSCEVVKSFGFHLVVGFACYSLVAGPLAVGIIAGHFDRMHQRLNQSIILIACYSLDVV